MWCFTITTLTFLLISINPTLSNLKKSELQDAIDAFDSFDTRPVRSISPRHKDTGTDAGRRYVPGAPTAIDVHSKLARDLALFFICEYNKITFPYNYFLVDIWSGTQQVVEGIKYVMNVVAGNVSGCREGAPADNCQLKSNVNLYGCHFEIIEQSWLNRTELLDFDCVPTNPLKDVTSKQEFIE
ncbi:cystatin-like isoform X1 [Lycorma delicatula]|uniref:cystatin-like isoform X1 n=1 Tax=Lycorma delicatula TaxID=130591 RepID=UPI003F519462